MDTVALEDAGIRTRPGLSFKTILGIAALDIFTMLITWRASVLETSLERESEQPALVDKVAPDFSATTVDGRTVSLA
jgi:hypothetical protein